MLSESTLKIEEERQETREFIELFKSMPKDKRRDIKHIMIGISLASPTYEEKKGA